MAVSITQENFEQEITQATQPVVLDVYATWCGPCQQMMPIVDELEQEFAGKIKFAKLNVEEEKEIAMQFEIEGIPADTAQEALALAAAKLPLKSVFVHRTVM